MKIFLKITHLLVSTYMKLQQNLHILDICYIHLHNTGVNGYFSPSSRTKIHEFYTPAPYPKHHVCDFRTQTEISIAVHQELSESVPKCSSQCRWLPSKAPAGTEQWQIVRRGIDWGSNKEAKNKSYIQLCSMCKRKSIMLQEARDFKGLKFKDRCYKKTTHYSSFGSTETRSFNRDSFKIIFSFKILFNLGL